MKPIVKIYVSDVPGKVTLTSEELEELISEAYEQGVKSVESKNVLNGLPMWREADSTPSHDYTPGITYTDWAKISTTSGPQTGEYTRNVKLYNDFGPPLGTNPTITNSATTDWARQK